MAILFALAGLNHLRAQDPKGSPWEKGYLQFGGFVATFNSELTFGVSGAGDADINGEDLLGLDSSLIVLRAEAMIRPGKTRRHQLDFGYGSFDRDGDATLSREITVHGVTYPVGAEIETVFNFDLIRATYSYAFLQNDWARVALGLGGYGIPLEYGLQIQTSGGRSAVEGANTILPMPALAFRSEFRLLPKLFLKASADGMYLNVSDVKASLVDANVGLEYRLWKHLGLGLAYNFLAAQVESDSNNPDYPGVDFSGKVDVRFNGLLLYAKFSF